MIEGRSEREKTAEDKVREVEDDRRRKKGERSQRERKADETDRELRMIGKGSDKRKKRDGKENRGEE